MDGEPLLFPVLGYLNGDLFLYYDSKIQTPEPRSTLLDSITKTDTWKTEKNDVKEIVKAFRIILGKVMEQNNRNTGSHIFQETLGCELHKDGSIRGFLRFGYNGEDFLTFHSETLTWEALHPAARSLKNAFEAEPVETKIQKAKLEGDYCFKLQKYLEVWNKKKAVPPSLNLTSSKNPKGTTTLKCRAYNLFPGNIKITLYENGYTLSQRDQEGTIIRPSGDGTYQAWASRSIYSEKSTYTCHVEHQGTNQTTSKSLVLPSLNLTPSKNPKGTTTLKCRAYNFFPGDIEITWYWKRYALSQRDQEGAIIQLSGDGTYQTWVSIDVYPEKSNYTCHVEHQGRNQRISISLGPVSEANRRYGIPPALFLVFLLLLCI